MHDIDNYREIIGDKAFSDLFKKVGNLATKNILNINFTAQGGGVTEILASIVILMNELGIYAGWRILHGNPDFFTIIKKFHNAIQGSSIHLSEIKKRLYLKASQYFSIITQASRFDRLKDPMGVIKIFKKVKSKIDCRLVLRGSMAPDDPEGIKIYEQVLNCAKKMIDKKDNIIFTIESDILVNVLQRISSIIIQKSIKEGFGLTVSEALWKETPVVASRVGGIPL